MDSRMLAELQHLLRPLAKRIANTVARGAVQLVNDGKKQQLLQVGVLADETIDDAEHFHPFGFSSVPLADAEAAVIFPNGDRSHAIVVAVSDRRHRPTGADPGTVTVYNHTGAKVTLTKDGDIEVEPAPGREARIHAGGPVETTIKADTYRSAEDTLINAIKTAFTALSTYAAAIQPLADPGGAATTALATAITALQTAASTFAAAAATYKSTVAKVQ